MSKPLVIDLFCGLGGWAEGFLAEGYDCVGFDIVRHVYGEKKYPGQLVLQDCTTLQGSQFKQAAVIVASPPCQEYSLWGMRMFHPNPPIPDKTLWNAAIRIGLEAGVPTLIENVRGAQYWWGRANWKCGPFYFWNDTPALWPYVPLKVKAVVDNIKNGKRRGKAVNARYGSRSKQRAEVTAMSSKIPFELERYIASVYKPFTK
jgi:C-5 cytosine-specific DNA methylase